MSTRYSKRQFDGTVEHYDSREEMEAANPNVSLRETVVAVSASFNPLFAFLGFVAIGIAATWFMSNQSWPTLAKFAVVIFSAGVGGYIAGKIGNALFFLAIALFGAGIIAGIAALVWHLL